MNDARDKARFKERLDLLIEAFKARTDESGPPAFIGSAYRDPLEHTTRRYLIDEMLSGLGWDLGRMTREIVEEARALGGTTLFLDYLGVNPELLVPLLIVEAKAWARPFVTPSSAASANQGAANQLNPDSLL